VRFSSTSSEDGGVIPGLAAWGSAFAIVVLFYRLGVRRGLLKVGRNESKWRIEGGAWWLERCEGLGRAAFHDTEVSEWLLLLLRFVTVCFALCHGESW
jgi:hypothetical protein